MLADVLWFLCGGGCGAATTGLAIVAFLRRPSKVTALPDDLSRYHTDPDV